MNSITVLQIVDTTGQTLPSTRRVLSKYAREIHWRLQFALDMKDMGRYIVHVLTVS